MLGRLDAALNAAGAAMQGAGSELIKKKEEAEAKLRQARADVDKAQANVNNTLKAFDDVKRKVGTPSGNAHTNAAAFMLICMHMTCRLQTFYCMLAGLAS